MPKDGIEATMLFSREAVFSLLVTLFFRAVIAANVNSGFDVSSAAQVMMDQSAHSWEWGTTAEALLELYNNDLSVFGSNPFPNGKIPLTDPGIASLAYARPFISTDSQVLVANSAVGDPASLGVSAILLGQSNNVFLNAAQRQADYILNQAPKWGNGAISHRPDVAEIWADFMAMAPPFLAYWAVQQNDANLMSAIVAQCGLQRDILKTSQFDNWQHIIGPQSQDTGLWSTGNGWACYGMIRVLHTLQKWSGSSGMTSQAGQLKGWIKEILDGAMLSGFDNGLLRNYLNDDSWFGEISGTALLTACAYRMAVNDPGMFSQQYVTWADTNRKAIAQKQGGSGVFSPAVDPYNWSDRTGYTNGSPEGQAFAVFMYTAYRDCIGAGICQPVSSLAVSTISNPGIGPIDILTVLDHALIFTSMSAPPTPTCGAPQSCDANGCAGAFPGLTKFPVCTGNFKGCECIVTSNTCGAHQSCDMNGCAGAFNGLTQLAQCTGNFVGCECTATSNTCGAHQSCDANGCAGAFNGLTQFAQCTGNFVGCECTATSNTCGFHQSCDMNGCAGAFSGLTQFAQCTGNFIGCECTATSNTCGGHQSCDANGCAGAFNGLTQFAQCTGNFVGCECTATPNTCGAHQSCDMNGCAGAFDLSNGKAFCTANFQGCECTATASTCGNPQSCDNSNCAGAFSGLVKVPTCTNFFNGCVCQPTSNTCGASQSCDNNGCAGAYDSSGVARCQGNFVGCKCIATSKTCGTPKNCDLNGCNGQFTSSQAPAMCTGNFQGCPCLPVASTCGSQQCAQNGCNGVNTANGWKCTQNYYNCPCTPPSSPAPPPPSRPLEGNYILIVLEEQEQKVGANLFWVVFGEVDPVIILPCCATPLASRGFTSGSPFNPGFPAFTISIDLPTHSGCQYIPNTSSGSPQPGVLTCPDWQSPITCSSDRSDMTIDCHGDGRCSAAHVYVPYVQCHY